MERAQKHEDLMHIPPTFDARALDICRNWSAMFNPITIGCMNKGPISTTASHHGTLCRKRGYTVAMLIEESRLFEVYLFTTLHKSLTQLDLIKLLADVVTVVDELDASKTAPLF